MLEKTNSRYIVAITGKNAAGKGEACNALTRRSYSYYSLSDAVRVEATKQNVEPSRENLIRLANQLREQSGSGVLAEKTVGGLGDGKFVIDSIRHPEEVRILKQAGNFLLIAIDAPIEIRFERAMKRGRNESADTLEKFQKMENMERTNNPKAQQLDETFKLADEVLNNDSTIDHLQTEVIKILKKRKFPV